MKLFKLLISTITSVLLFVNVSLAEKWDMALAYGAGNFHSANAAEFAKNVTEKSGGKLTIVTHPGGSLFKGGEIFRAVLVGLLIEYVFGSTSANNTSITVIKRVA